MTTWQLKHVHALLLDDTADVRAGAAQLTTAVLSLRAAAATEQQSQSRPRGDTHEALLQLLQLLQQFNDQPDYVNYVVDALWDHCTVLKVSDGLVLRSLGRVAAGTRASLCGRYSCRASAVKGRAERTRVGCASPFFLDACSRVSEGLLVRNPIISNTPNITKLTLQRGSERACIVPCEGAVLAEPHTPH